MKWNKKTLLTLGAMATITLPMQTIIVWTHNSNYVTKKSNIAIDLPSLDGSFTGLNKTPDAIFVESVTPQQIYLAVNKVGSHASKATMNAAYINALRNVFTIAPHDVKVQIHATGDDNTRVLSYTVTSVQLNEAKLPASALAALGGSIGEFAPVDQIAVDNLTIVDIYDQFTLIIKTNHLKPGDLSEELDDTIFAIAPYNVMVTFKLIKGHYDNHNNYIIVFQATKVWKFHAVRKNLDALHGQMNTNIL